MPTAQIKDNDTTEVKKGEVVSIPIVVRARQTSQIEKGARIVIADIAGPCTSEVKDALMRRLTDNSDYSVLTRDNLEQIIFEAEDTWAGKFNTETAVRLGELMGASLWIVGRVVHCGHKEQEGLDIEDATPYNVSAVLQIIDLKTGKVLASMANEGNHIQRASMASKIRDRLQVTSAATGEKLGEITDSLAQLAQASGGSSLATPAPQQATGQQPAGQGQDTIGKSTNNEAMIKSVLMKFGIMAAADDMANGFADKFFGRPRWETVEMWDRPGRAYTGSLRYVQLGHCPAAAHFMSEAAAWQLPELHQIELAEYLHNYGVALLCANQLDLAAEKFRSSYRLVGSQTTLKMLGLTSRLKEWDMVVEPDLQPEIKRLIPVKGAASPAME